jgi:hypothetical protein
MSFALLVHVGGMPGLPGASIRCLFVSLPSFALFRCAVYGRPCYDIPGAETFAAGGGLSGRSKAAIDE